MKNVNIIKRMFEVSDPVMRLKAQIMLDHFVDDKAQFTAFDPLFNDPFAADMQTKINIARFLLDNKSVRDQLQIHT